MADTTTAAAGHRRGFGRRTSSFLNGHERTRFGLTIGAPLLWIGVIYLGALVLLFLNAFWRVDTLTGRIIQDWGLQNFDTLWSSSVYRTITFRTVRIAALVTVADVILSFPLAYYAARIATPRVKALLLVMVVLPLWASYLVKAFAWQTITAPNGLLESLLGLVGIHVNIGASEVAIWLTFTYLWLPFVLLPIFASLERIPRRSSRRRATWARRGGRPSVTWCGRWRSPASSPGRSSRSR